MLLSADARVDLLLGAHGKFGGHHHVLPAGKVPESAAQILLAGAVLIHDGRIKEVDAQFQGPADDARDDSSSSVQLCWPWAASPNPMQPRHTRDTFRLLFPSLVYCIIMEPFLGYRLLMYRKCASCSAGNPAAAAAFPSGGFRSGPHPDAFPACGCVLGWYRCPKAASACSPQPLVR